LNSNGGRDVLNACGGRDSLDGGGGQDTLAGGRGGDQLTGGNGRDTFQFSTGDGADVITDFQQGLDRIEVLDESVAFNNLRVNQSGDDVLIAFANVRITILDDEASNFTASDFLF